MVYDRNHGEMSQLFSDKTEALVSLEILLSKTVDELKQLYESEEDIDVDEFYEV